MIDTNGHGRVSADEVVVALTPRSEKWYLLHRALFHTADPEDEYRAMAEAVGRPECAQS